MMRILPQPITVGNDVHEEAGLAEACRGVDRAVAARLAPDASFADREQAVLAGRAPCRARSGLTPFAALRSGRSSPRAVPVVAQRRWTP